MSLRDVWGPAADKLFIVGLTGGIASGKSVVLSELSRLGAFVIDADEVAREVTKPGREAFSAIVREFGEGVLDGAGRIDRQKLARQVFGDEQKRLKLNSITHPAIFSEMRRQLEDFAGGLSGKERAIAVVDAALIVDVGAAHLFDAVVVVAAPEEVRLKRLTGKRGMDRRDALMRMRSQLSDEERARAADLVIDNSGTIEDLREKVQKAWQKLVAMAREHNG